MGAGRARLGQPLSPYPKIELHVHLEGTMRPETLLEIARRNDYALPTDTAEGVAALYDFQDFAHFIEVWVLTTNALRTAEDFRQVLVDYAGEAASHGAVYLEGIFSPAERVRRGVALGGHVRGVLRRRAGGARAPRARGAPDAGHHARLHDGGGGGDRALGRALSGSRRPRRRTWRARGGLPAGAVCAGLRTGPRARAGVRPARGRGRGPGVDPRRAGRPRRRPASARHPLRRGPDARRRAARTASSCSTSARSRTSRPAR